MLAMLKTWCPHQKDEPMTAEGRGASFQTAVGHIVRVYQYLFENCRQRVSTIRSGFNKIFNGKQENFPTTCYVFLCTKIAKNSLQIPTFHGKELIKFPIVSAPCLEVVQVLVQNVI